MSDGDFLPEIHRPEPIQLSKDTATPEANAWWYDRIKRNRVINPIHGEIAPPPDTAPAYFDWLETTLAQVEQSKEKLPFYSLHENDLTVKQAATLLQEYAQGLLDWHKAERRKDEIGAYVAFGQLMAFESLTLKFNLEADRKFIFDGLTQTIGGGQWATLLERFEKFAQDEDRV